MATTTAPVIRNASSHQVASDFYKASIDYGVDLYMRWQCEKEFEDFADYAGAFEAYVQSYSNLHKVELKFIKATKRPFGFQFKHGDNKYQFKVTSRECRITSIR
jgi:hypothetical protein